MKRFITLLVALSLIFSVAAAEKEPSNSVWDSLGEWAGQAWDDASGWASQAWKDASVWIEGAWGDASKWIDMAWNESAAWATEIWGDVSTWAAESYEAASGTVGAWWTETFKKVTESTTQTWKWIEDEASRLKSEYSADLEMVRSAVFSDGPDREQRIRTAFDTLLGKLHISASDILRIWDTIRAYAEYKNIPLLVARKLVLPYLLELVVEGTEVDGRISAITISQFITGIMEKIGIDSGATLEEILARLMNTLGSL